MLLSNCCFCSLRRNILISLYLNNCSIFLHHISLLNLNNIGLNIIRRNMTSSSNLNTLLVYKTSIWNLLLIYILCSHWLSSSVLLYILRCSLISNSWLLITVRCSCVGSSLSFYRLFLLSNRLGMCLGYFLRLCFHSFGDYCFWIICWVSVVSVSYNLILLQICSGSIRINDVSTYCCRIAIS